MPNSDHGEAVTTTNQSTDT